MLTLAQFQLRFPEFGDLTQAQFDDWVSRSKPYFNVCRWAGFYDEGLGYWIAHGIAMQNQAAQDVSNGKATGSSALMSNMSVDQVSVGFDSALKVAAQTDPYLSTVYGQRFEALQKLVGMGAIAI